MQYLWPFITEFGIKLVIMDYGLLWIIIMMMIANLISYQPFKKIISTFNIFPNTSHQLKYNFLIYGIINIIMSIFKNQTSQSHLQILSSVCLFSMCYYQFLCVSCC